MFRLRFRFVPVVRTARADEAKLRGRMTIVVLIVGHPLSEYRRVFPHGFSLAFVVIYYDFDSFLVFFLCASSLHAAIYNGFETLLFFYSAVQYLVDMTFKNIP